jgi:hypothetical protein
VTSDAVETAAQLIHQLHRAGTANVCGECREVAREVAEVLDGGEAVTWPEGLVRVCPRCSQAVEALPGGLVCQECTAALCGIEQRATEVRDRDVWVGEAKTARYILGDDDA